MKIVPLDRLIFITFNLPIIIPIILGSTVISEGFLLIFAVRGTNGGSDSVTDFRAVFEHSGPNLFIGFSRLDSALSYVTSGQFEFLEEILIIPIPVRDVYTECPNSRK